MRLFAGLLPARGDTRRVAAGQAEQRSVPLSTLERLFEGPATSAGVSVNERKALSVTGLWRGVSLVSGLVGALSLFVNEHLEPRGRRHAPGHPVYRMLHKRANPEMSSQTVRETLQQHAMLWGNGYAEIEFNGAGFPMALWPLLPDRTWPERRNGVKRYITMLENEPVLLTPDRVLHIHGLGFDGLMGYSLVQIHRENIARPMALRQFGNEFYGNAASPSGVLEHPNNLSEEAQKRLADQWHEQNVGLTRRHRTVVLEEGMQWKPVTMPLKDAEFLATEGMTVIDGARMIGVPPHKLYELGRATWNNIEAENINFHTDTMLIWLTRWENEMDIKLFPEREVGRFYTRFAHETILRADAMTRAQSNQIQFQNGALTIDEWRELEDRNAYDDDIGAKPLVMGNMTTVEKLVKEPEQASETPQGGGAEPEMEPPPGDNQRALARAFRGLLENEARRCIEREVQAARKAAKSGKVAEWLDVFYASHRGYVERLVMPVIVAMGQAMGDTDPSAGSGQRMERLASVSGEIAQREVSASVGQLRALLRGTPPDELEGAIVRRLNEWAETRPAQMAERELPEIVNAINGGN